VVEGKVPFNSYEKRVQLNDPFPTNGKNEVFKPLVHFDLLADE
jgi:hypothetical protein